jgi:hypothetical protein
MVILSNQNALDRFGLRSSQVGAERRDGILIAGRL